MKKSPAARTIDYYAAILKGTRFENDPRDGIDIPYSENLQLLNAAMTIGSKTAPNRIVYQPMEGQDADENGNPTDVTFARYEKLAAGGPGIIWLEAVSVLPEARSNRRQLLITPDNLHLYRKLTKSIKNTCRNANGYEPLVIIQLNHAGRHSKPDGSPRPIVAHHIPEIEITPLPGSCIADDAYLSRLVDVFRTRALLAVQAGFDGVDVKCCHGYLYSELLSAYDRGGAYGGSFENRIRLLCDTVSSVKGALPADTLTCCRLNVYDGYPFRYRFGTNANDPARYDLTEPKLLIERIRDHVDLLNVTVGSPYYNPDVSRPYRLGIDVPPTNALMAEARMFRAAKEIHEAFSDLPCVNTGISGLCHLSPYAAAGMIEENYTDFVGFGRMTLAYPSLAADILNDRFDDKRACVACSGCSTLKKNGLPSGCIVRNPYYRDIFRKFRGVD